MEKIVLTSRLREANTTLVASIDKKTIEKNGLKAGDHVILTIMRVEDVIKELS